MEERRQKSWFSRNWPWVVPLGGCLTMIIIIIVFAGSLIFGISTAIENSTPFDDALSRAKDNPAIIEYFGDDLKTNGIFQGSFNFKNDEGDVNLSVPIKGTKRSGRMEVKGTKTDGVWQYEILQLIADDDSEIFDLSDSNNELAR
ncbi:MAG: cytochrome c oxidase assembly factor 1 family protein [Flavobacteriaceae bacterium]|nr:cytochrome c oxidase assembly factor 1 family protein [Flavobacteriaceae bacterium]